ncbi:type III secretion system gatekeeper subunit SctW [Hahella ganghwensis]|uniref:type III secretion system gatekeeper subunit SctW n=1 Tax=Hahella ganghwensis TaxID=286420 RepID=UPI00037BAE9A|nr:type III secretion system gatekeeper subunit SctW [Hahella ganghwensis]
MSNVPGGITFQSDRSHYTQVTHSQAANGQWRGEGISLSGNDKSLFASAAEEMSFLRSEKKETDLNKRKISDRSLYRTQALEKAIAYLEKTKDLDKEKQLKPFFDLLLNQPKSTRSQIRQLVSHQFSDISQQFMALAFVRDQLRRKQKAGASKGIDSLLSEVEIALDELMAENGSAIQAGLNVAEVASLYSESQIGTVNRLRELYRDAVLDYGSLTGTFQKILAQYGPERFSDSLSYLISALGADLAAEGPSLPKERLKMIIEDLYKLQALESLDDECTEFLLQLERIYHSHTAPNKYELMEQLLVLLEKKWLSVDQLRSITKALKVPLDMDIYFWRGFKELARLIPLKAYNDPFERERLITAIQDCLDNAIEKEEELD